MTSLVHPEAYSDYYSPVLAGEAVPSVYHSLVEAAIRDGTAPARIVTARSLRGSLWSVVSLVGAVLILLSLWWIGLPVMIFAVWAAIRHTKPLNVRLGYCAVVLHDLGTWGVQRGYLSLMPVPKEHQESWAGRNDELLELAERDANSPAGQVATWIDIGLTGLLFLGKLVVAILLIASAWKSPG